MRKLMVTTFVSLDGVMQAPGGADEDRDGGFEHGGWAVPHFDPPLLDLMADLTSRAGALLVGRRTYDIFAATWPLAEADDPIGATPRRSASPGTWTSPRNASRTPNGPSSPAGWPRRGRISDLVDARRAGGTAALAVERDGVPPQDDPQAAVEASLPHLVLEVAQR
jgi:hypothetical protein